MTRSLRLMALLVLAAPPWFAAAQTYEQLAPKLPPAAPAPTLPPAPVAEAEGNRRVLVPTLQGVRFVARAEDVVPAGVDTVGLDAGSVPLLQTPGFGALVSRYLGRALSFKDLNQLVRDTVLYCREHDRPIVDVLVPEQNVSRGSVQIVVLEGRLGRITAEGMRWFTERQLVAPVRLDAGEVIAGRTLLEDLSWLNQNPFRQVDLVFSRGANPGETDIILRTKDRRPVRLYAAYDDSGNALTGDERVQVGINWGNAFGQEHLLNYQFTGSRDLEKLVAHSGSYVVPIARWRHTLTIFGSYAESEPELAGGWFDLTGTSWQASARYAVPLKPLGGLTHQVTGGLDFKRSNNNLAFGGTRVFAQETDVVQGSLAYDATRGDRWGSTSFSASVFYSPGGLSRGNHTTPYRAARAYADPEYVYGRVGFQRTTRLPHGASWILRGVGQITSTNLLGSEQLGLGGYENLRGYEEREANGDEGWYLINEIHAPSFALASRLGLKNLPDRFVPLAFFDYGNVSSHRRIPGEASRIEMASAGAGFRYQLGAYVTARLDYGWQLRDSGVSDGRLNHRGHFSITVAY